MRKQYARQFNLELRNILIERVANEGLLKAFEIEDEIILDLFMKFEKFATQDKYMLGEQDYTNAMRRLTKVLNKALDKKPEDWFLVYLAIHDNKRERKYMKDYLFTQK